MGNDRATSASWHLNIPPEEALRRIADHIDSKRGTILKGTLVTGRVIGNTFDLRRSLTSTFGYYSPQTTYLAGSVVPDGAGAIVRWSPRIRAIAIFWVIPFTCVAAAMLVTLLVSMASYGWELLLVALLIAIGLVFVGIRAVRGLRTPDPYLVFQLEDALQGAITVRDGVDVV